MRIEAKMDLWHEVFRDLKYVHLIVLVPFRIYTKKDLSVDQARSQFKKYAQDFVPRL